MAESLHDDLVAMVAEVSSRLLASVVDLDPAAWDGPGLGEWSLRELVGHTLRAFTTVDRFLDEPREHADVESAGEYYRIALGSTADVHRMVADRGREAGAALGADPAASAADIVTRTLERLSATTGAEIGVTAVGGMRLTDYLETRLVELVVHLSDVCAAIGRPVGDLGAAGVRAQSTVYASASAADRDLVLRSMLGRASLPGGFSVWP